MREIGERSDGAARLGPTTLYRSLEQLLALGLVEEAGERPMAFSLARACVSLGPWWPSSS